MFIEAQMFHVRIRKHSDAGLKYWSISFDTVSDPYYYLKSPCCFRIILHYITNSGAH